MQRGNKTNEMILRKAKPESIPHLEIDGSKQNVFQNLQYSTYNSQTT